MAISESPKTHDIIIIGAGTAGCVLANRLSEDPSISVLILEAGEYRNDDELVYTPGLGVQMLMDPKYDWQYISEPQPGINGRQMKHPRGKMVGGSSAINSFALTYPSAAGLDVWAKLGNDGWGWDDLKSYFRKFQTVCMPNDKVDSELDIITPDERGNGPIQASYPITPLGWHIAWQQTFSALGLQNTSDPRDGAALGGYISTNHISDDRHERSHAGVAYYDSAKHRSNVTLVTGALVQRILFDSSSEGNAKATGVQYIKDGTLHQAAAGKEVILAAGTFASPQVLQLSGIGNKTLLQQIGIETIYHNPNVGENLQDHVRTGLSFEATDDAQRKPLPVEEARRLYEEKRMGPWAENACYTFAYLPLDHFLTPEDKQHLSAMVEQHLDDPKLNEYQRTHDAFVKEMIFSPTEATTTAFLARKPVIVDADGKNWITIFAMLSHQFSRGSTHIVSTDAATKPKIDFGYYTHPLDLEVHARHLQAINKIANTAPLADLVKQGGARLPVNKEHLTLDEAKEVVREYSFTNYHPCGTCSMIPEKLGGVVDSKLRVYGTANLRVVDASIMPVIPRCNIITTLYASAEKAADIVSQDLGIKRST